jgi:hypothetical protein
MTLDSVRRAPFGFASVVFAGAVLVYLVVRLVGALSDGYGAGDSFTLVFSTLLPLNGSLALAPVLLSLPLGIVSLVKRERPRWGLWGVILSGVVLLAAVTAGAAYLWLLLGAITQTWS